MCRHQLRDKMPYVNVGMQYNLGLLFNHNHQFKTNLAACVGVKYELHLAYIKYMWHDMKM